MGVDLQPDELEAMQAEPEYEPPVKVVVSEVVGPVRTQALPRKSAASRSRTVSTGPAVRVLTADHRRASAKVISKDQAIYLAFNQASASDFSTMALWPVGVPYELTADCELWITPATGSTTVSVITEFWATGE